jgi:molybdate transport system regulatory protein
LVEQEVALVPASEGARFPARNRLTGTVSRLQPGGVNTEVVIDLAGGGSVTAIVTNESSQALGLGPRETVSAIFKASSVILAVPA